MAGVCAGVVPTMDIVETASSNASSEDALLFDESTKRHNNLDSFYPSHDMVQPPRSALLTSPAPGQCSCSGCPGVASAWWSDRSLPLVTALG